MLSQNRKKLLVQLTQKKRRDAAGLFVAEGRKTVGDLLRGGLECTFLATTSSHIAELRPILTDGAELAECTADELAEVSALQTRTEVIAIFRRPTEGCSENPSGLTLVLDEVQDPGNMGTIIRTADWFGVRQIVCSRTSADAFGPKTVQATMGALSRVRVAYVDLPAWLARNAEEWHIPVYGTFLGGENIYTSELPNDRALVVMGNEGRGISREVEAFVSHRLLIPSFPPDAPTSESLNVSTATAITLSEFRRRVIIK